MTRLRRAANLAIYYSLRAVRTWLRWLAERLGPGLVVARLVFLALAERARTTWRRLRRRRPRLIWGPTPIVAIKYWSGSMRERGYESRTLVRQVYPAQRYEDFDVHRDEFGEPGIDGDVRCFAWAMRHGDLFSTYFELGILRDTPYRWLEYPLLRLAGKRIIVSPYGSDVAVVGTLGIFEEVMFEDYPVLRELSDQTRERILHTLRWANLSIRNYQHGFQPEFDVFWPTQGGIDADRWRGGEATDADGHDGEVTVVHAPNHRRIKGTAHLIQAVRELSEEGLRVRLDLLEGRPNEEVRAAVLAGDLVCEQLVGGYALFAIEGMAAGKPVLSNMEWVPEELQSQSLRDCPIVSTTPETLREDLRRLVEDPARRRELGRAGEEFVRRYHSYAAIGEEWEAIVEHVWRGAPLPERLLPPERSGEGP